MDYTTPFLKWLLTCPDVEKNKLFLNAVTADKEAKAIVDGAPKVVKEGASKAEAEDIKTKLEAEGAKVTLK